ncbi:MAG: threonine synthase [Acidimicrobiaceae bacterium]|nr:threonine synthase [Acidimicrobiaceae bacterium]HBU74816.1 threonine synthase [Acidimicrobiaceae bacterium]
MRYVSTRGTAPELGFSDVLLSGLASDGGLYVPTEWPTLPAAVDDYSSTATSIMATYIGDDISSEVLEAIVRDAYATFRHSEVAPLVQIEENLWVQELFHGPTLAFKDLALQVVGRLFDHVLAERSDRVTIVGATSGDTGSAAIDAVKSCDNVDIVILYPRGRTSDVQRRQMTTVDSPNVHVVAVDGTFDDCQDLVKAMFADEQLRRDCNLSAVNSINWARVMAQIVYYVTASQAFAEPATFCVPTGNFGNVLAGWIAKSTGASIDNLLIASNANDILARFVNHRDMSATEVVPTLSPSMDIQVSSNFERLLFEMNNRNGGRTAEQLKHFRSSGVLEVEEVNFRTWISSTFSAERVDDEETLAEIGRVYRDSGMLIDPHTATGTAAARRTRSDGTTVCLSTAHPAKFPDAVEKATGIRPELPPELGDLMERTERMSDLPAHLAAVSDFVRGVSRVSR